MESSSIITTLLFFLSFTGLAQSPALSGRVLDNKQQPIAFADAVLLTAHDSLAYRSFTDETGKFAFTNITPGNYKLTITTVGFTPHSIQVAVDTTAQLPDITLHEAAVQLSDVVINSRRPIVKRKVDRTEFDVENSILSSENAWEILRKTPSVTLGINGLSIRGSEGILITINDKKVYLTGTELKNLLENTNGEDIKMIEVITTPPAKYEAQGSAVLNIKMRKNGVEGYKSSLSGAYVQTMYPKGVLATNHYYKDKKFAVYGGYMFGSGHYYSTSTGEVRYLDSGGAIQSAWKSRDEAHYRATSQNSYNLNAEYEIDTLNTVGVGINGFFSLKSTAAIDTQTGIYNAAGQLDSLYNVHNQRRYPQKNNTINAFYEHKFNAKAKIAVSSDYTKHFFNQEQIINTAFSLPESEPYRFSTIDSDDNRRISLFSLQTDYNGESNGYAVEAGLRYGNVNADNDFTYRTNDALLPNDASPIDNRFLYDEHVFAAYAGAEKEFGKWNLKAGLRGEYTELNGNSVTTNQLNKQDYFKLFPTLYAMYKANENNQIGVSYGKRIIRPQYAALNPFRLYATPYNYSTGDPGLQPAISHNFSLTYTLKNKHNFDLYYNYQKDPATEITFQDYATRTLVTQFTNIDNSAALGFSYNTATDVFTWWQQSWQADVSNLKNTFMGPDMQLYTNKKWNGSGSVNNRFTLNKKKDLTAEANFYYQSAVVSGAYIAGAISALSCSLKKTFWEGNAELAILFSDVYRGQKQNITTEYSNQYSSTDMYNDTQTLRVQFRYRFGNQKLAGKTTRQDSEEKSRL